MDFQWHMQFFNSISSYSQTEIQCIQVRTVSSRGSEMLNGFLCPNLRQWFEFGFDHCSIPQCHELIYALNLRCSLNLLCILIDFYQQTFRRNLGWTVPLVAVTNAIQRLFFYIH